VIAPLFAPRRELGNTGFFASALGIGDIADRSVPIGKCVETVQRALDAGLNVIDTAPGYEDGYSEEIVGRALCGRRDPVFVIDKIDHPGQPVMPQVDASLRRLAMDFADLLVFHGVSEMKDWDAIMEPGGAMDQLGECVMAGKARFRGVSSHHPDVLKAAIESGTCNVVMFAIGPFCHPRYGGEVLPLARERGVGTVCFKTFGAGKLLGDTPGYNQPLRERPRGKVSSGGENSGMPLLPRLSVPECLHYTLTLDPDVALLGLSFPNEQDAAFAAALDFAPLSEEKMDDIRRRGAEAVKDKGKIWWDPQD
jgi:aryl-alcohol dehydrogenase-like predicted oxidoreductase